MANSITIHCVIFTFFRSIRCPGPGCPAARITSYQASCPGCGLNLATTYKQLVLRNTLQELIRQRKLIADSVYSDYAAQAIEQGQKKDLELAETTIIEALKARGYEFPGTEYRLTQERVKEEIERRQQQEELRRSWEEEELRRPSEEEDFPRAEALPAAEEARMPEFEASMAFEERMRKLEEAESRLTATAEGRRLLAKHAAMGGTWAFSPRYGRGAIEIETNIYNLLADAIERGDIDALAILGVGIEEYMARQMDNTLREFMRERYLELARQFHPDRFSRKPEVERRAAEEKFKRIQNAYDVIKRTF